MCEKEGTEFIGHKPERELSPTGEWTDVPETPRWVAIKRTEESRLEG